MPFLGAVGWPVVDRFRFGDSLAISPHGIGIAIGFLIGAWLLGRVGPQRGGVSAGALLINLPRFRGYGYRFFQVMDAAVIALALGIAIGRIGDLVIGDHLGTPTSWALAFRYDGGELAPPFTCEEGRGRRGVRG